MAPPSRTTTTRALDQRITREPTKVRIQDEVPETDDPNTTRAIVPIPIRDLPVHPDSVRDAPPPPLGYRYTLEGRLVPVVESRADLTEQAARDVATTVLERTGSLRAVTDALGLRPHELKSYLSKDPIFAEDMEMAADRHREAIYASAYMRATEGYEVPIVGGKDKDTIVAYERRYSDSLTKTLLQRHYPEFRPSASSFTVNKIETQNNLHVDPRQLPKADRDHLRRILKAPPEVVDATGIEVEDADSRSLEASPLVEEATDQ